MKVNPIHTIWDDIEAVDPDISTERLLQMVADEAGVQLGGEWDVSDIAAEMQSYPGAEPVANKRAKKGRAK